MAFHKNKDFEKNGQLSQRSRKRGFIFQLKIRFISKKHPVPRIHIYIQLEYTIIFIILYLSSFSGTPSFLDFRATYQRLIVLTYLEN